MSTPGSATPGDAEPTVPLETAAPVEKSAEEQRSTGHTVSAVICVILAALLTTPAAVAFWGQRTLNDTQRYVDTVEPLVSSPEVQDAIATTVTDAIEKQVDIEAILANVFAGVITDLPRLEQLVGPLSAAINGLIDREVRAFLASNEFADLWARINARAQQGLQQVLKGEGSGAISVQGDELVLDVDEVIDQVKQRLVDRGLTLLENVPTPASDRQIVLLESSELEQVRTIYAFGNPIAKWLLPLVALLYLGAFLLAGRRPRMAVWIGALLAANAVLIALILAAGRQLFINQLSGTVLGPASTVFYNTLLAYLDRGQEVILALGLVLVVAGWFAGSNKYGTAVRSTVAGGLEDTGARLSDGPVSRAGGWVSANVGWLRVVVSAIGVVVLLWGLDVSLPRLWWSLALVLVLLAFVQVLVGAARGAESRHPVSPSNPEVEGQLG